MQPFSNQQINGLLLPTELLSLIFTFTAISFHPSERNEVNQSLIPTLLSTCGVWRLVALRTPSLWTAVDFRCYQTDEGVQISSWEKLSQQLSLSGSLGIDMRIDVRLQAKMSQEQQCGPESTISLILQRFQDLVWPHIHRLRHLVIADGDYVPDDNELNLEEYKAGMAFWRWAHANYCPKWTLDTFFALPSVEFLFGLDHTYRALSRACSAQDNNEFLNPLLAITSLDLIRLRRYKSVHEIIEPLKQLRCLRIIEVTIPMLYEKDSPIDLDFPVLECLSFIFPVGSFKPTLSFRTPNLRHLQLSSTYSFSFDTLRPAEPDLTVGPKCIAGAPSLPHLTTFQALRTGVQNEELYKFINDHATSLETLSLPIMTFSWHASNRRQSKEEITEIIWRFAVGSHSNSKYMKNEYSTLRIVCLPNETGLLIEAEYWQTVASYVKILVELLQMAPNLCVEFLGGYDEKRGLSASNLFGDSVSSVQSRWRFLSLDEEDIFGQWFDTTKLKGICF